MDSSELYRIKQLFFLGAYKSVISAELPDVSAPDYTPTLLYKVRSLLALGEPKSALKLIPADTENVALKAATALCNYIDTEEESALEAMRDVIAEIEGDDGEGTARDKAVVRVLAGTAFARAGEVEEALDSLGNESEDLEA